MTREPASEATRGRLLALGAGLLWSMGGVFIKSIALPAPVIAALRSLFAGLAFLPFVRRAPARSPWVVAASVICYTVVVGLFVVSTKLTTAANAIILQYTAPAWVFLLEVVFRGARPDRRNTLTLLGGMAGITIIWFGSEPGDLLGISLALLSGVFFAAWMVLAAAVPDMDPVATTAVNNLGSAALLAPVAWSSAQGLPSTSALAVIAVMATFQLGIPYLLFSRAVKRISSQEASLIVLVEPVMNPVWVALFVGEVPSRATLLGGGVILAALALRYLWPARRPRG